MPTSKSSALQSLRGTIEHLLAVPPNAPSGADLERRFAEGFFRRSDEVYLLQRKAELLFSQWRNLYRWVAVRKPREVLVRVFVPETGRDGYTLPRTVVQTCVEDQTFLFSTVRMALEGLGVAPIRAIHPILGIVRNDLGVVTAVEPLPTGGGNHESVMHFELPLLDEPDRLAEIEGVVRRRIEQAQAVVADWGAMVAKARWLAGHLGEHLPADADYQAAAITQRFFHWLTDDHFVFQGYSEVEIGAGPGEWRAALGIDRLVHIDDDLEAIGAELGRRAMFLGKSARDSEIHRIGKLDVVVVRLHDNEGSHDRLGVFTGLYTAKALHEEVARIPMLREKLARVLEASSAIEGSHLWNGLQQAFRQLPVEFLLEGDAGSVERATRLVFEAEEAQETGTHLIVEANGRAAFFVVALPRERYDDDLRRRVAERLRDVCGANYLDWRLAFGQTGHVVLQFYITAPSGLGQLDEATVRASVAAVTQTWTEAFLLQLRDSVEPAQADALVARYAEAFPEAMQLAERPESVVADVPYLERLRETGDIQVALSHDDADPSGLWQLKVFQHRRIDLTASAPILELFGLRVLDQRSARVRPEEHEPLTIDTFRVEAADRTADLGAARDALTEALCATLSGTNPSDRLNTLVLTAGLRWRDVEVLRLYIGYARQLGAAVPYDTVRRTWCNHPDAAAAVVDLFRCRFDPAFGPASGADRQQRVDAARAAFLATLSTVEQAADDRILRRTFGLVEASLRTNFWAGARLPGHPLSVKFDCEKVPEMPQPRPYREIFVHHEAIEGVHLRGGPVARGGLRWSDRPEDYRTEILGLMATQMVKNVLIVPVGAKGGFILRHAYGTWKEARAAADELYKVFIRGLLDVTDNVKEGVIVPPTAVVRYDGDDPYLVVAADKGTAHLSNTANSISAEYGFWLGDAFASGGSQGYDHKLYAITAKGAWVCTRRHFREMGIDPERDPITAVGIGDMSGDVFGNGLLLSQTVRLLAAFDHRHIFLDPNPGDGLVTWTERKRLFDLPGSSWADYDRTLVSEGGGVWPKNARTIGLSPPVRALLGTEADELPGEVVVKLILGIQADLLWNGGIGTWVKASSETHRDAADSANDAVRMDARDLRFKVIGEGGNLGFTQAGRVEFARRGGRINTDALDNSGGVDMSDHEVNLKILFQDLERRGQITREERNACLVRMAGDVARAVEGDNYHHSLMISLDLLRSRKQLDEFRTVIRELEKGGMDRTRNAVPDDAELSRRVQAGEGLVRPELCRVGPHVKMMVYDALRGDPTFFTPYVQRWLRDYFPTEVQERWDDAMLRHQLRVDIAATVVTNFLVDALGATHWSRLMRLSGRGSTDVAFASLLAFDLLDAWTLCEQMRDIAGVEAGREYDWLLGIYEQVGQLALWLLQRGIDVRQPEAVLQRFQGGFRAAEAQLDSVLDRDARAARAEMGKLLRAHGLWKESTARATALPYLAAAGEAVLLAERFPGLGAAGGMALLRAIATDTKVEAVRSLARPGEARDEWEARALAELNAQVEETVADLAARALPPEPQISLQAARGYWTTYLKGRAAALERVEELARGIEGTGARGLAPAAVLARAISDLRA